MDLLGGIMPMLENIFPIAGALTGDGVPEADKPKGGDGLFGGLTSLLGSFMNMFDLVGGPDFLKGMVNGTASAMQGGFGSGGGLGGAVGSIANAIGGAAGGSGNGGGVGAALGALGG